MFDDILQQFGEAIGKIVSRPAVAFRKFVVEKLSAELEEEYRDVLTPVLEQLKEIEGLPEPLKDMIDRALERTKPAWAIPLLMFIGGYALSLVLGAMQPLSKVGGYQVDKLVHSGRLDPSLLMAGWFREIIPEDYVDNTLKELGYNDDAIDYVKKTFLFYPSPQDLITWQAREVFEPEMVSRYGLDDEFENIDLKPFEKAGISEEQARNYWRAHWTHASLNEVREMLHRKQLTEEEVYDWFRLVEIPPFWREKITNILWNVPTRVDVRRWWDMRTIDEARLREVYEAQGYHGDDLDDYVLWTKVYVAFPDLVARYKNGWINADEVKSELVGLGMSAERAEEMIQTKIKSVEPERTTKERDLTVSNIIKGMKIGHIDEGKGKEMLTAMGYDEEEAQYLIDIEVAPSGAIGTAVKERDLTRADILGGIKDGIISVETGFTWLVRMGYDEEEATFLILRKLGISSLESPAVNTDGANPPVFQKYNKQVQSWRKSVGLSHDIPDAESIEFDNRIAKLKIEISNLEAAGVPAEKYSDKIAELGELEALYRKKLTGESEAEKEKTEEGET